MRIKKGRALSFAIYGDVTKPQQPAEIVAVSLVDDSLICLETMRPTHLPVSKARVLIQYLTRMCDEIEEYGDQPDNRPTRSGVRTATGASSDGRPSDIHSRGATEDRTVSDVSDGSGDPSSGRRTAVPCTRHG